MQPRKLMIMVMALLLPCLTGTRSLPAAPADATYRVDSTLDEVDENWADGLCRSASGACTLRAAVMQSNSAVGQLVEIVVPPGVYRLTLPNDPLNDAAGGDLDFLTPSGDIPYTNVIAPGFSAVTIIDGDDHFQLIHVHEGRRVGLYDFTLRNGHPGGDHSGGAIFNLGYLDLVDTVVHDNQAFMGAGVANFGTLYISGSSIRHNIAAGLANSAGGIYNALKGIIYVENSTISGNVADSAGAIFNWGSLFIANSTISGNAAFGNAGAIYNQGKANIYNTTITGNEANLDGDGFGQAGGIFSEDLDAVFNLRNTIVAGNFTHAPEAFDECHGVLASYQQNLIGLVTSPPTCIVKTVTGSWEGLNSLTTLGPLRDNGGPTVTHALLPGSNAIDNADGTFGCVDWYADALEVDQRNADRVVDGDGDGVARCDVGAFEMRPPFYFPFTRS